MKKRIISLALALVMTMALAAPAFAEEEASPAFAERETEEETVATSSLAIAMALTAPVMAEEEETAPAPEYRLTSISVRYAEENWAEYDYTFSYDEGGYLPSSYQWTEVGFGPNTYTLSYDEENRIISERAEFCGPYGELSDDYDELHYIYNEDGRLIKKEDEYYNEYNGHTLDMTEYTYDDDGVFLSAERTITDNDGNVTTEEGFPESKEDRAVMREALYSVQYPLPLLGAGYGADFATFGVWLEDSECQTIFSVGFCNGLLSAEPQLTYDENGYLIKADDGAGNYMELTYEPVT